MTTHDSTRSPVTDREDRARTYSYVPPITNRIVAGHAALSHLPELLSSLGAQRTLVITSPALVAERRLLDRVTDLIGDRLVGTFGEVRSHSPVEVVMAAHGLARRTAADSIVSIGGGSSIDTAKGVVWYTNETADEAPLVHIAVPSTLSGAEYTTDAGITTNGLKQVHRHRRIVPAAVLLDPDVAATAPIDLLRTSLLNALAHCLEGVVSVEGSPMTDAFYLHAIRQLRTAAPRLEHPDGRAAAQAASALAALHQVKMGLAHALVHVIGGRFRTPHGATHAIVGPAVMRFNLPAVAERQRAIADAFGRDTDGMSAEAAAWEAVDAVRRFRASLGAPPSLKDLGLSAVDLDVLAEDVLTDGGVATNPRTVDGAADARLVLEWAWSGDIPKP